MARIVEFIECEDRRGRGIEGDPIRRVTQYWTKDGELVFELDPCKEPDEINPREA